MSEKISQKDIKSSLIEQLKEKGINKNFYIDLINDYVALWVVKQNLIKDIALRGVNVEYKNGENQYGTKQNDSVLNLIKVNNQMLKILSELGLKGADQEGEFDYDL